MLFFFNCTYELLWGWFIMLRKCFLKSDAHESYSTDVIKMSGAQYEFCISQLQITMDGLSVQEWTEMKTGVWTSPEPPDPAFSTRDSQPEPLTGGMVNSCVHLFTGILLGYFCIFWLTFKSKTIWMQHSQSTGPVTNELSVLKLHNDVINSSLVLWFPQSTVTGTCVINVC